MLINLLIADALSFIDGIIENKVFVVVDVANHGYSLLDTIYLHGFSLYLTQFYTITAQFHLVVDTAKALQFTLLVEARKVACMIHSDW